MKRIIIFLMLLACVLQVKAQTAEWEYDRLAVREAVGKAEASLRGARFNNAPVALLPMRGDGDGDVASALKSLLSKMGYNCVEAKDDPMWAEIIKEVEWDERKDDILDPNTIVSFGKLQAAKILIYGGIRTIDRNANRVYAEIDLHATNLDTKQHMWGGTFASRVYFGQNVNGVVTIDNHLKALLKKNFDEARATMTTGYAATRLSKVNSVAVVPMIGDIDQYMTGLAIDMLSATKHTPKDALVPSLLETRVAVRNRSLPCDAVFYGYIRDLNQTDKVYKQLPKVEKVEASWIYSADIQMFIEDAATGDILWSKTVTLAETVREDRDMTAAELQKLYKELDQRNLLRQTMRDKAETAGSFRRVAKEMEGAVIAARTAMNAGKWAEVIVYADAVLNRADEDEVAAKWKKEAMILKKKAEEKIKVFDVSQIDQEIETALAAARVAKGAGKWEDVRIHVEAALRIPGGGEKADKARLEARQLLGQAQKWMADQALSKVDTEIEELVKTAREAMKNSRWDIADIYAKMALRMEGGTAKAERLRSEAKKLVEEIAVKMAGAKVERIDAEIKKLVESARNAMQQERWGEAGVYAKIAASIEGGSNVANELRSEAKVMVEKITGLIEADVLKAVAKAVETALKEAEADYKAKKWNDAIYKARAATGMRDFNKLSEALKTRANSLLKQINESLQDEEIRVMVEKAETAFTVDDLYKARGYASSVLYMESASTWAKNQRTKAQNMLEEIKKRIDEINYGMQENAIRELLAQAQAAYDKGDWLKARDDANFASRMPGSSESAKILKVQAESLANLARDKYYESEIRKTLTIAQDAYKRGDYKSACDNAMDASTMPGDSETANNLKKQAERLVVNAQEGAIQKILSQAKDEFNRGYYEQARDDATTASTMQGDSETAKALKKQADDLAKDARNKIDELKAEAIRKLVASAQDAYNKGDYDKALADATEAKKIPGNSEVAENLRKEADAIIKAAIDKRVWWRQREVWVTVLVIIGVLAALVGYKIHKESEITVRN